MPPRQMKRSKAFKDSCFPCQMNCSKAFKASRSPRQVKRSRAFKGSHFPRNGRVGSCWRPTLPRNGRGCKLSSLKPPCQWHWGPLCHRWTGKGTLAWIHSWEGTLQPLFHFGVAVALCDLHILEKPDEGDCGMPQVSPHKGHVWAKSGPGRTTQFTHSSDT